MIPTVKTFHCYVDYKLVAIVRTRVGSARVLRALELAYPKAGALDVSLEAVSWKVPS